MLRFGTISATDPAKGLARVRFEEDDIVSGWLPIRQDRTLNDKTMETMDVGEHVACLMDENAENGVIVGAIYNTSDLPEGGGADVFSRKFKDGTVIKYDRAAKKLTAVLASGGTAEVTATEVKVTGNLVVTGSLNVQGALSAGGGASVTGDISSTGKMEADGEVTAKKGPSQVNLSTHKHPTAPSGPVSSPTPGT